ncbi:MAG: biotin--[acetyl-CoA-carboxylase] ligase [Epsilonproteobacteria bacterium]|nr:biotin--[acetyl-CoA-carboxylase] ligase [Campylobacterota bacterium]
MSLLWKMRRLKTCDNTMAWARQNFDQLEHATVIVVDKLEHAQGRQGRSWQIMPGQLLVTFILKPELGMCDEHDLSIRLNQLDIACSLGILEPLLEYGVGIKWPNDFVLNDKKIGGMLAHALWQGQQLQGLIFGFALNANTRFEPTDELSSIATSIAQEQGSDVDMRVLFKNLLTSIGSWYQVWLDGAYDQLYKQWRQHQVYLGKKISVHRKDGSVVQGTMTQVLPNGDMMLLENTGSLCTLSLYVVESIQLV